MNSVPRANISRKCSIAGSFSGIGPRRRKTWSMRAACTGFAACRYRMRCRCSRTSRADSWTRRGPRSIEEKRIRDGKNSYLDWDDTNEVTIVCTQWWEREPYYLVADEASQEMVEMSPKEYKLLDRLRRLQGMPKLDGVRMSKRVYKQAFLGNEELGCGPAPCGDQFSWGVMTGEWDAKKRFWFGLTRVVRDPQMWANKFMSQ